MADIIAHNLTKASPALNDYLLGCDTSNSSEVYQTLVSDLAKLIIENYNDSILGSKAQTLKSALNNIVESKGYFSHNAIPRGKNLGSSITSAQNTAIQNRTYDDLYIGDYWNINNVKWRIWAIDYYYNIGDQNFNKGNIIVVPDTILYSAQMNNTESGAYESGSVNTTVGAYLNSDMRITNLNQARTIATTAFGNHVASHRIMLATGTTNEYESAWAWQDSDGVELMTEIQVYGTRVWNKGQSVGNGYGVAAQKMQFPLALYAPQIVNIRQSYWLQDVASATNFALVHSGGNASNGNSSSVYSVRPAVTLSYI